MGGSSRREAQLSELAKARSLIGSLKGGRAHRPQVSSPPRREPVKTTARRGDLIFSDSSSDEASDQILTEPDRPTSPVQPVVRGRPSSGAARRILISPQRTARPMALARGAQLSQKVSSVSEPYPRLPRSTRGTFLSSDDEELSDEELDSPAQPSPVELAESDAAAAAAAAAEAQSSCMVQAASAQQAEESLAALLVAHAIQMAELQHRMDEIEKEARAEAVARAEAELGWVEALRAVRGELSLVQQEADDLRMELHYSAAEAVQKLEDEERRAREELQGAEAERRLAEARTVAEMRRAAEVADEADEAQAALTAQLMALAAQLESERSDRKAEVEAGATERRALRSAAEAAAESHALTVEQMTRAAAEVEARLVEAHTAAMETLSGQSDATLGAVRCGLLALQAELKAEETAAAACVSAATVALQAAEAKAEEAEDRCGSVGAEASAVQAALVGEVVQAEEEAHGAADEIRNLLDQLRAEQLASAIADATEAEVRAVERQAAAVTLDEVMAQVQGLSAELEAARVEAARAEQEGDELRLALDGCQREAELERSEIDAMQTRHAELERQLEAAVADGEQRAAELEEQVEQHASALRGAQEEGGERQLRLVGATSQIAELVAWVDPNPRRTSQIAELPFHAEPPTTAAAFLQEPQQLHA